MANLGSNQSGHVNKLKATNFKSCFTSKSSKYKSDTIQEIPTCDHYKSNFLKILHQNVRGLSHKINELLISLPPNPPQILCLTEHHLQTEEIVNKNFDLYTLGAHFCRQTYKQGGVCIYVSNDIQFSTINLDQFNREKDLEICALKLCIPSNSLIITCIYRSPQ
jgi:hypothetical protein